MSKCKRGRPIGGKSHPALRDYWRNAQQLYRASKKFQQNTNWINKKQAEKQTK